MIQEKQKTGRIEAALDRALLNGQIYQLAGTAVNTDDDTSSWKNQNLMISGRTGYGKTARILAWADEHKELNFVAFQVPQLNLRAAAAGTPLFTTYEIDRMAQPDSVIFLDDYDLASPAVSEALNEIIDNRRVQDAREASRYRRLEKVLFLVAAITTGARRRQ